MAVLALDIATLCGWAVESEGELHSGTWRLKPRESSCDQTRELVLWRKLQTAHESWGIDCVAFEDVVAHGRSDEVKCKRCGNMVRVHQANVMAAQLYGALRGIVRMWCDNYRVPWHGVPVGTLKLFATGHGRASKDDMISWAKFRWRDQNICDDNQADALHVLDWCLVEVLKRRGKQKLELRR